MGVKSVGLASWNARSLDRSSRSQRREKQRILGSVCTKLTATAAIEAKGSHASVVQLTRQWNRSHVLFCSRADSDRNIGLMLLVQKDFVEQPGAEAVWTCLPQGAPRPSSSRTP